MMQQEFEKLVGYEVSSQVYKAIEQLYMNCNLGKAEFAKRFKSSMEIFALPKTEKKNGVLTISLGETLDGCHLMTFKAEIVDKDRLSGKPVVKEIPNSFTMNCDLRANVVDRSSVILIR